MVLVDVHAHLDICEDADNLIANAKNHNVSCIINNATDEASIKRIEVLAQKHPICKCAFGIYPDTIVNLSEAEIERLLALIKRKKDKCIAIGEIGLDYKWTKEQKDREKQKKYFIKQIQLATQYGKPVIIHSRNAEEDVIDILEEHKCKAILHCFSGKKKLIPRALKAGIYFSIPVKAVNDKQFQQLIDLVPLNKMFLETDSPYLHYVKGEKNQPANIRFTIDAIAKIKDSDPKEIENQLYANFLTFFAHSS